MSRAALVLLVGVDGSTASLHAMRYALRLCAEASCRLHVCNVQPGLSVAGMMVADRDRVVEHMSGAPGEAVMAEARALCAEHGVEAEWLVLHGEAPEALAAHARTVGADLLLVGSRGLNPARELLLGSVARRACELAPCPVVIAR